MYPESSVFVQLIIAIAAQRPDKNFFIFCLRVSGVVLLTQKWPTERPLLYYNPCLRERAYTLSEGISFLEESSWRYCFSVKWKRAATMLSGI